MLKTFLIDDDLDDQEFFCMAMKRVMPDVECTFADDCGKAIERLKDASFTPQLIFIDINMPRMNGIECLRELRQMARLRHIPAFMYSTSTDGRVVDQCLQLGANGVLKKQFSVAEAKKDFERIITQCNLP